MADTPGGSGFVSEALEKTPLVEQFAVEKFWRPRALADGDLLGEIDGAYGALAQAAHKAKPAREPRSECGVNFPHRGKSSVR
jgi:hypothetical protein